MYACMYGGMHVYACMYGGMHVYACMFVHVGIILLDYVPNIVYLMRNA